MATQKKTSQKKAPIATKQVKLEDLKAAKGGVKGGLGSSSWIIRNKKGDGS